MIDPPIPVRALALSQNFRYSEYISVKMDKCSDRILTDSDPFSICPLYPFISTTSAVFTTRAHLTSAAFDTIILQRCMAPILGVPEREFRTFCLKFGNESRFPGIVARNLENGLRAWNFGLEFKWSDSWNWRNAYLPHTRKQQKDAQVCSFVYMQLSALTTNINRMHSLREITPRRPVPFTCTYLVHVFDECLARVSFN
jgi:hypothetical protein